MIENMNPPPLATLADDVVSDDEILRALNVSRSTLDRRIKARRFPGPIPSWRPGKRRVFRRREVQDFLLKLTGATEPLVDRTEASGH